MYVGDKLNNRVRKIIASTNFITTIAGTGAYGYSGDGGAATAAAIAFPHGVNLDNNMNVYFGDYTAYNVIRKVTVSTGVISTVAGTGSTSGGYNGDNIQATSATLYYPHDVVFDSTGNMYISDRSNNRIRKVDMSTGVITTVIGTGTASSTGDGSASTSATTKGPCYSRFDSSGNYYISECEGNRVRKVMTVTTDIPTVTPTFAPSPAPTNPTGQPTRQPSAQPSTQPTSQPSRQPTSRPTGQPTRYSSYHLLLTTPPALTLATFLSADNQHRVLVDSQPRSHLPSQHCSHFPVQVRDLPCTLLPTILTLAANHFIHSLY